jgi:hypothetical protein
MERQFRSDFCIVILSPNYIRDFNQNIENSSGARFEASILSSVLLSNGLRFDAIALVCFDDWKTLDIPSALFGCTRYYVDRPGEYEKLYSFLTNQILVEKPPLGKLVTLKPTTRSSPTQPVKSFPSLCRLLWPLMEDNRRIFEDFGPNSGAAYPGPGTKKVRFDLTIWELKKPGIGTNNELIANYLRSYRDVIPEVYRALFSKWLSHIEAFALHLAGEGIDYRDHQFPKDVVDVVKGEL